MITIKKSPTADTRTCDFANTSKDTLLASSRQHIIDVQTALRFMAMKIDEAASVHDHDKISDIDGFHRDFITGFTQTTWWDKHRKVNRHHLLQEDGVPSDVNLIDVLDMICDCVMAGMARSGSVYPLDIKSDVLRKAFDNTVEMLKSKVQVEPEKVPPSPTDFDARVLADGSPIPEDGSHKELTASGQQRGYVVLTEAERSRGFVRPYRDAYRHLKCGRITTMGRAIAETYARDFSFYSGTFCSSCGGHFSVGADGEFTWYEMDGTEGPKVGT